MCLIGETETTRRVFARETIGTFANLTVYWSKNRQRLPLVVGHQSTTFGASARYCAHRVYWRVCARAPTARSRGASTEGSVGETVRGVGRAGSDTRIRGRGGRSCGSKAVVAARVVFFFFFSFLSFPFFLPRAPSRYARVSSSARVERGYGERMGIYTSTTAFYLLHGGTGPPFR